MLDTYSRKGQYCHMSNERELLRAFEALKEKETENQLAKFRPYDCQLPFLNDTTHKIRALVAGNQVGKSYLVSYEMACHLTGIYPPWWRGVRYVAPVDVWIAGVTAVRVRDTVQEKLFGRIGRLGTGMIPKHLVQLDSIIKKTGTPYAFDRVEIKHVNGGCSTVQFFSYDQGMEKFMGSTIDIAWFDEEPPADINAEVKMRLIVKDGILLYSFTPLQGVTPLYDSIMQDDNVLKVRISQSQVPHLDQKKIDRALEGLSESEKQARRDGVATIGAGKVFQFEEHEYTCEPFEIPPYWRRLGGFDVGLGHPTGAVACAIDDDSKTIYVYNEYKVNETTAVTIASHLRHWGLKFMADPSVFSREIATAQAKSLAYTDEGMELIKGNRDREEGIHIMRKYFGSGRLWIFDTCQDLLKELRTYRTKTSADGHTVVVKVDDDVVDALRYCIMGIEEYAEVPQKYKSPVRVKTFKPADPKVGY